MPELPEGTINAFIQNKNLAKYGLLKDNEGGFLAENFVHVPASRDLGTAAMFSAQTRTRPPRDTLDRIERETPHADHDTPRIEAQLEP